MKLIQLAAPGSNSGKTITTIVLSRLLNEKGYDVRGFKCGPDFIDSKFLSIATGNARSNLDLHLMSEEGMRKAISLNYGEMGIVEGAMGYFDGIGRGTKASAFDIAKSLDINTILVYRPQGEMFSIIPKLKGILDYSEGRIKGIIFSMTRKMMYHQLKQMVEENLELEVLGHIEQFENLQIPNEELGLIEPVMVEEFSKNLTDAAIITEETINLDRIIELMNEVKKEELPDGQFSGFKMGIAKDMAFSFHYGENEKLLEKYFEIEYFSPLYDKKVPEVDIIYIPGGKVENFKYNLSRNTSMLESIKEFHENKGIIYGESGGLSYLSKELGGAKMCGVLNGVVHIGNRLQNFGYVNVELSQDCILGKAGTKYPAHEYHYTYYEGLEEPISRVKKASLTKEWQCGYKLGNSYFSFQHINFCGNENIIENIISFIKEKKCI
ncbi:MAG: cobyrinate a,c-diamide synthase [Tissierellia bacterium]|nr:cobyrinate a,c-diamide synthase [Tissierellia bacterium]